MIVFTVLDVTAKPLHSCSTKDNRRLPKHVLPLHPEGGQGNESSSANKLNYRI